MAKVLRLSDKTVTSVLYSLLVLYIVLFFILITTKGGRGYNKFRSSPLSYNLLYVSVSLSLKETI